MKNNCLLLILVMAMLAIGVHVLSFEKSVSAIQGIETVKKIPLQLGAWRGKDFPLDPMVYDILETRSILHRDYQKSRGQEVFLSLVYYQETKVDFHAPEGCLGGLGMKTEKSPAVIQIKQPHEDSIPLKVNKLLQHQDNTTTLVYYFYKTGDFMGRDYLKLRMNLVLNKFKGGRKSGSLIRISTQLSSTDDGKASHEELEQFINKLFPYLVKYL